MKILVFNWRCWLNPAMGGAEVFTYEVVKRWIRDGHEVILFTSEFPGCKREEVVEGVRIVRAGRKYSVYGKAKKYYRKRFSKENYDIIIDEINTRPFFTPKFVNNGEKVVGLVHQLAREYWFYEMPFPISYFGYHFFEERWLKNYVNIPTVAVSDSTKQDLLNLGFKDVCVVSEGLNFTPLMDVPEKESFPVIVYAGRLKRAKRPDHAVEAFRIIKERLPQAEFWLLGNGPFRAELKKMACDGMKFFGSLSNKERRELLRKCWVLVNPSVREGWGLNVIEANALGVPAIAYDVHGLCDSVKDGETGLLAESGDTEDLAGKIIMILEDDLLRHKLSENALKYAKEFSWDKTAEHFVNVLERVVNGR